MRTRCRDRVVEAAEVEAEAPAAHLEVHVDERLVEAQRPRRVRAARLHLLGRHRVDAVDKDEQLHHARVHLLEAVGVGV